jgi:hypothetical protein
MSYTEESNPDGTGRREREKAYKQRNSDGKNTFEGERSQAPPGFDRVEYPLPKLESERPTDRSVSGAAERHEHAYDPATDIDWVPEP